MRKEDTQKRLSDLGQLIVELQPDACRQERKRFDNAFDVRVLDLFLVEQQTRRDLWISARKISPHSTQENEFAFIIREEFWAHELVSAVTKFKFRCRASSSIRSTRPSNCRAAESCRKPLARVPGRRL